MTVGSKERLVNSSTKNWIRFLPEKQIKRHISQNSAQNKDNDVLLRRWYDRIWQNCPPVTPVSHVANTSSESNIVLERQIKTLDYSGKPWAYKAIHHFMDSQKKSSLSLAVWMSDYINVWVLKVWRMRRVNLLIDALITPLSNAVS